MKPNFKELKEDYEKEKGGEWKREKKRKCLD
jgi:hypothetical protein